MPGQPLLTLDRQGVWQVRAEIPESLSGRIRSAPRWRSRSRPSARPPGTVAEVQPATDPHSRSFQVKIDLPAMAGLVAGLYARVLFAEPAPGGS